MNLENAFTPYDEARKLTEADSADILNLYSENAEYFNIVHRVRAGNR